MAKIIGIVGGRAGDIRLLRKAMHVQSVRNTASISFYRGTMGNRQIVLCQSGVGKVNAALAAQTLVDTFHVSTILGTGIAGSLRSGIGIGNLVVATKSQQHDVNFTALGYPPGVIPGMKTSVFIATPAWVHKAYRSAHQLGFPVYKGKVLSGDEFVASPQAVAHLRRTFGGLCVDSIGAGAIGQVAYKNKIGYTVIRGISDKAGTTPSKNFSRNSRIASLKSQLVILTMLIPNYSSSYHTQQVSGA
ncbi:5'-methylthioadenosine/adenosylhomocysteine nucleosidase [Alicyclobacillus sp. SO9]|uniref:5'-methylthioadenosine/adenosylhomocysteine nucleosidase n=1 Tax=Alicyclobacillus sp. SO9 TaxID=2665646 RepID=UPI0018E75F04|nr:5'-methylthioadenosine/adenosylhomocysteine nucleosidase [Alicyclobacillus sp. SO9]QQE80098.1 5'-methylthioadenosine/adenosylhomocysteine nucleosidase [Alicyclobacillus sp. SO9]